MEPVDPVVSPHYGVMLDGVDRVHTFAEEQIVPTGRRRWEECFG
ncbi:hypothetical protein [Streptomyces coffeae]|nr:hypothetical protein [Streptomyces coffeae]